MAKSFPNAVLSCELYYFQSKLTSDELPSQPADGFQWKVSESPNTKTIPLSFFKSKKEYLKAKLSKINFEIGYWQGKAASPQFRLIFDLDVQWSYNRENQNLDWQYVDYYLEQKETPSLLHTLDYRSTRTGTDRVKRQRLFCQLDLGY